KFDCRPATAAGPYTAKFDFESPHTLARDRISAGARVLDIGCAAGYLSDALRRRGCHTTALDAVALEQRRAVDASLLHHLTPSSFPIDLLYCYFASMRDASQHPSSPENVGDD